MTTDEYVIRVMDQDDRLRDRLSDTYFSAQMDNIRQMRNLITQFIIISSGIIGFTIPVLGKTDLVKSQIFLIGGLGELLVIIIFGFFYLTQILQKENNELTKQHKKFSGFLDKQRDARNKFLSNMNEANWKEWQTKQKEVLDELQKDPQREIKQDYALNIIFSGFFISLMLLVLSLVSLQDLLAFL